MVYPPPLSPNPREVRLRGSFFSPDKNPSPAVGYVNAKLIASRQRQQQLQNLFSPLTAISGEEITGHTKKGSSPPPLPATFHQFFFSGSSPSLSSLFLLLPRGQNIHLIPARTTQFTRLHKETRYVLPPPLARSSGVSVIFRLHFTHFPPPPGGCESDESGSALPATTPASRCDCSTFE